MPEEGLAEGIVSTYTAVGTLMREKGVVVLDAKVSFW